MALSRPLGFLKDYPPDDDEGYLEFARGLELPDFYEAIRDAKPLTPVSTFRFPANRWRRYDQLSRFPAGMLVIGDAIASFNPVYGQGMSTCALEVEKLRLLLDRLRTARAEIPSDFSGRFFRQSAKIIQVPWMLATQSDFLYPQTRGKRPVGTDALNWYLMPGVQLHVVFAAQGDPVV